VIAQTLRFQQGHIKAAIELSEAVAQGGSFDIRIRVLHPVYGSACPIFINDSRTTAAVQHLRIVAVDVSLCGVVESHPKRLLNDRRLRK
jgi:hypothetical protein